MEDVARAEDAEVGLVGGRMGRWDCAAFGLNTPNVEMMLDHPGSQSERWRGRLSFIDGHLAWTIGFLFYHSTSFHAAFNTQFDLAFRIVSTYQRETILDQTCWAGR